MRFYIHIVSIFALHFLVTSLLEQTVIFIPKLFKIAKLCYLAIQNTRYSIYALLFSSNFDFCAVTLKR